MKRTKIDFMDFPYTDRNGEQKLVSYSYKLWFRQDGSLEDVTNIYNTLLPKNSSVFEHFNKKICLIKD